LRVDELAVWGQDRLWVIEDQLNGRHMTAPIRTETIDERGE